MGGIGAPVELGPDATGPLADEVAAGLVDPADDEVAGEVEAGSAAVDPRTATMTHTRAIRAASRAASRRGECSGHRTAGARASHSSPVVAVRLLVLGIEPAPLRSVHLKHPVAVLIDGQVRLMDVRGQPFPLLQGSADQRAAARRQCLPWLLLPPWQRLNQVPPIRVLRVCDEANRHRQVAPWAVAARR